jgi:mannose-6-phosphate isomerase-like protein (cupin superfamily)
MPGKHTIKNLREVTDAAVKGGFSEVQEARFATGDLEAEATGVSYLVVKPGRRQAFGHRHGVAEEVYVVVRGNGRLRLDDEVIDVAELDAIRVAPQVTRKFEAGDEGLEFIAFGPRHQGDGEIFPDFWVD